MCSRLAQTGVHSILKETKGAKQEAQLIKSISDKMSIFTKDLATCRCRNISADAAALKELASKCSESNVLPDSSRCWKESEKKWKSSTGTESVDGVTAARWCLTHNLIQQGYTILSETVLSRLCLLMGLDAGIPNDRSLASEVVTIFANSIPQDIGILFLLPRLIAHEPVWRFWKGIGELVEIHINLSQRRNDINHCGENDDPRGRARFEKQLGGYINQSSGSCPFLHELLPSPVLFSQNWKSRHFQCD